MIITYGYLAVRPVNQVGVDYALIGAFPGTMVLGFENRQVSNKNNAF